MAERRDRFPKAFVALFSVSPRFFFNAAGLAASLAPVPGLAPAVALLEIAFNSVQSVHVHRELCEKLLQKALAVIETIRDNAGGAHGTDLEWSIQKTMFTLDSITEYVKTWAAYSFWTSWVERNTIESLIAAQFESLEQCKGLLGIAAVLQTHGNVAEIMRRQAETIQMLQQMANRNEDISASVVRLQQDMQRALPGVARDDAATTIYAIRTDSGLGLRALAPAELQGECRKLGSNAYISGSTFDVWQGVWLGKARVALKCYRNSRHLKNKERFDRQINIWRNLDDQNVLKFHGWCIIDKQTHIVCPWMDNGNIMKYLNASPEAHGNDERIRLVRGILLGLQYLREQSIAHGCLRPSNVLVTDGGDPVLADFAVSKLFSEEGPLPTNTQSNSETDNFRYQAPEVSDTDDKRPIMSPASDVYSWGMTALEVLSGQRPHWQHVAPNQLMKVIIMDKGLPEQKDHDCDLFREHLGLWELLASCWDRDPTKRPTVEELLERLPATGGDA